MDEFEIAKMTNLSRDMFESRMSADEFDAHIEKNTRLSPYFLTLRESSDEIQTSVDGLLKKHHAHPIGDNYTDLILSYSDSLAFINDLTEISIAVDGIEWWCLCTEESKLRWGCPHGYGGPPNKFGAGYFSECVQYPGFLLSDIEFFNDELLKDPKKLAQAANSFIRDYLTDELPAKPFFSPCLHPSLWLYLPFDWKRKKVGV